MSKKEFDDDDDAPWWFCSGSFEIESNYLLTDANGFVTRITAAEYEEGLYAGVEVVSDTSGLDPANQLLLVVHNTYLDVTDSWLFGRMLAKTYAEANDGESPQCGLSRRIFSSYSHVNFFSNNVSVSVTVISTIVSTLQQ